MTPRQLEKLAARVAEMLDPTKLPLPPRPKVVEIRVRPYQDHQGYDAFEVWIILDESTTAEDRKAENTTAIRGVIHDTLLAADIEEFPYTHFARRSEMEEAGLKI